MSTIIANINFLASLGITTQEQFEEAFGDMETFDSYCQELGYTWEIDENNDIILTSSKGKTVDSQVSVLVTAQPEFVITEGTDSYTIEAVGEGTVKLYAEDTEVSNPCVIERTSESQVITFTATAQEDGKIISEEAEEEIEIPALNTTAMPEIDYTTGDTSYVITAVGNGEVKLYADGTEVANPYTVTRTNSDQTITFTATAQEQGKLISDTAEEEITVLALPMSTAPTITATQRDTDYLITVTAGQDAVIDIIYSGDHMANPFAITRGNSDTTVTVTATATEPNHQTATTIETITILALPVTSTPSLSGVTNDTNCVITATGSGEVKLYADGSLVDTGTGSASHTVNRGNTSQTIAFTATAQEANKQISATATLNFEVQALPVTATPTISYVENTNDVTITATGTGTSEVKLYIDGTLANTGTGTTTTTVNKTATAQSVTATATAQEPNKQISATASQSVTVPAIKTATPTISYVENTNDVVVTASGNGTVLLYADGSAVANPYTVNKTSSVQTIVFTATAQESGKAISDTATDTITIPAVVAIPDYLKLTSAGSGNIIIDIPADIDSTCATSLSYSKDGSNWTDTAIDNTAQTITIPVQTNDVVYLKGIAKQWGKSPSKTKIGYNMSSVNFSVSGNIMSLLYGDNFENQTSLPSGSTYTFAGLFSYTTCSNASQLTLPATTLVANCYRGMFENSRLTSAPALPATTLATSCYSQMFSSCILLTSAPALPATTLAQNCYQSMFTNCTRLTSAPTLPATTLAQSCYNSMFSSCTSLTTAPALPATTMKKLCYSGMFNDCTSLTSAPALPATTLADGCYGKSTTSYTGTGMFQGCTSLTSAPALPATTLATSCYCEMFQGCTSLTSAPALPATTLTDSCYKCMFQNCTGLTSAPALPATTLADGCYNQMFKDCTSLTSAPTLSATAMVTYCYASMFQGCTSLTAVTMLATSLNASGLNSWLYNTAANGTLTVSESLTAADSSLKAPDTWTIVPARTAAPTITSVEGTNDVTITATGTGTVVLKDGNTTVANPYVVAKTSSAQTLTMKATAKDSGHRISTTTTETVNVPAAPQSSLTASPASISLNSSDWERFTILSNGTDVTSSCTFTSAYTDGFEPAEGDLTEPLYIEYQDDSYWGDDPEQYPSFYTGEGYYCQWDPGADMDSHTAEITATYNGDSCTIPVTYTL